MRRPPPDPVSPLGDADAVAATTRRFPDLADDIADLEAIVTPEFDRADRAAIANQAGLKRNRLIELTGGVITAILAIIRLGLGDDARWAGAAAATVAAATGVVALAGRNHGLDQWLDHRRVAEELRSLYFRWLVSDAEADATERRARLRAEVNRIIAVEPIRVGPDLTGDDVRTGGSRLDDATWQLYREARLRDQLAWMRSRSDRVAVRSNRLRSGQIVLMGGAAVCGLLSGYVGGRTGVLLAVPIAATATMVAFLAAIDALTASEQVAQHYERTVRRLEVIDRSLDDSTGSLDDVEEIENVLMAEHRTWHRITEGNQT